eukprot:sb/3478169/
MWSNLIYRYCWTVLGLSIFLVAICCGGWYNFSIITEYNTYYFQQYVLNTRANMYLIRIKYEQFYVSLGDNPYVDLKVDFIVDDDTDVSYVTPLGDESGNSGP